MNTPFPAGLAPHFGELESRWAKIPPEYDGNARAMLLLLEAARAAGGGQPVTVTSWYRSPLHNAAVGGSKTSQHLTASAVDVSVSNPAIWAARVAGSGLDYGQVIYYAATSGHVHLSLPNLPGGRRGEYLVESSKGRYIQQRGTEAGSATTQAESEGGALAQASGYLLIVAAVVAALAILGVF